VITREAEVNSSSAAVRLCVCVADNGVNMANRATVNHRAPVPTENAAHQPRAAAVPTCNVTFKRLPFYDVLGEIMKPSSLGLPRQFVIISVLHH